MPNYMQKNDLEKTGTPRIPDTTMYHQTEVAATPPLSLPFIRAVADLLETESGGEEGKIYLAGAYVSPGLYRQIGGSRELHLEQPDYLPASLDGRVACYMRVEFTWRQISQF